MRRSRGVVQDVRHERDRQAHFRARQGGTPGRGRKRGGRGSWTQRSPIVRAGGGRVAPRRGRSPPAAVHRRVWCGQVEKEDRARANARRAHERLQALEGPEAARVRAAPAQHGARRVAAATARAIPPLCRSHSPARARTASGCESCTSEEDARRRRAARPRPDSCGVARLAGAARAAAPRVAASACVSGAEAGDATACRARAVADDLLVGGPRVLARRRPAVRRAPSTRRRTAPVALTVGPPSRASSAHDERAPTGPTHAERRQARAWAVSLFVRATDKEMGVSPGATNSRSQSGIWAKRFSERGSRRYATSRFVPRQHQHSASPQARLDPQFDLRHRTYTPRRRDRAFSRPRHERFVPGVQACKDEGNKSVRVAEYLKAAASSTKGSEACRKGRIGTVRRRGSRSPRDITRSGHLACADASATPRASTARLVPRRWHHRCSRT